MAVHLLVINSFQWWEFIKWTYTIFILYVTKLTCDKVEEVRNIENANKMRLPNTPGWQLKASKIYNNWRNRNKLWMEKTSTCGG